MRTLTELLAVNDRVQQAARAVRATHARLAVKLNKTEFLKKMAGPRIAVAHAGVNASGPSRSRSLAKSFHQPLPKTFAPAT